MIDKPYKDFFIYYTMELKPYLYNKLFNSIPDFELSYETISHKKVSNNYNICLAIPHGKKFIAWFTFFKDKDVCYIFELNKDKKPCKCNMFQHSFIEFTHGTVIYGSIFNQDDNPINYYIIEDAFYYMGIELKYYNLFFRITLINDLVSSLQTTIINNGSSIFSLPVIWDISFDENKTAFIPHNINSIIPYPIHHIQYRSLTKTIPYFNVFLTKKLNLITKTQNVIHTGKIVKYNIDFQRPLYRRNAVFKISPDIQNDIYHLYAYGKNKELVFYNIAFIPSYKSSIFMNKLFRNVKENRSLDYIEESDDEDDFQNINIDKNVDLKKVMNIECFFNFKFKKWVPIKVIYEKNPRIAHIKQLVDDYYD